MSYNQKYFVVLKGREKKNKQKTRTKQIGSQCQENGEINKQLYRYLSIRDWIHVALTKAELNQMSNWRTGTCMREYENSLGACFSKVPKLFGRISGDIILFVSSKRRRLEARNFAVIFTFIPFTTYEKISSTE